MEPKEVQYRIQNPDTEETKRMMAAITAISELANAEGTDSEDLRAAMHRFVDVAVDTHFSTQTDFKGFLFGFAGDVGASSYQYASHGAVLSWTQKLMQLLSPSERLMVLQA